MKELLKEVQKLYPDAILNENIFALEIGEGWDSKLYLYMLEIDDDIYKLYVYDEYEGYYGVTLCESKDTDKILAVLKAIKNCEEE